MKKLIKWFSIFAVIGTAIGLAVAYFCKNSSDSLDDNDADLTEDEDFDLDNDLKSAADREYVPLNTGSAQTEDGAGSADSTETNEQTETKAPDQKEADGKETKEDETK